MTKNGWKMAERLIDDLMDEQWLATMTCYGLNVGFEENLSEAPLSTQDASSATGKFNLDS